MDEPADGFDDADGGGDTLARASPRRRRAVRSIWATRRLDVLLGLASGVTLLADGRVRYSGSAVETLAERALAGTDSGAAPLDRVA